MIKIKNQFKLILENNPNDNNLWLILRFKFITDQPKYPLTL